MPDALAVVRQAAESKPDDPIYRLVLAMLDAMEFPGYNQVWHQQRKALELCAREIEAAE